MKLRQEVLTILAHKLHEALLRDDTTGFTGQVTLELNYASGEVKTAYVNMREGVRLTK